MLTVSTMSHDEFIDVSFDELEVMSREGEIIEIKPMEDDVYSLLLKLDQRMLFYPGQYILVDFQIDGEKITRAYTKISSSLDDNIIELNIQKQKIPSPVILSPPKKWEIAFLSEAHTVGLFAPTKSLPNHSAWWL